MRLYSGTMRAHLAPLWQRNAGVGLAAGSYQFLIEELQLWGDSERVVTFRRAARARQWKMNNVGRARILQLDTLVIMVE
jgi:hypothetical protein